MQKIRKGDLVQVVTGADRGKQGHVLSVDLDKGRVRVESVRIQKRHLIGQPEWILYHMEE